MDFLTIAILGIGLSMDAFAVSVCKGLALGKMRLKPILIIAIWFGIFHALMPVIGFYLGRTFYDLIESFDHWVAFILLAFIGGNMLREALSDEEEDEDIDDSLSVKTMLPLSLAISIDALAVGISMAMDGNAILIPATIIGCITATIAIIGVAVGSTIGDRVGNKADILGGAILIIIAFKVLFEGLGLF